MLSADDGGDHVAWRRRSWVRSRVVVVLVVLEDGQWRWWSGPSMGSRGVRVPLPGVPLLGVPLQGVLVLGVPV